MTLRLMMTLLLIMTLHLMITLCVIKTLCVIMNFYQHLVSFTMTIIFCLLRSYRISYNVRIALKKAVFALGFKKPSVITLRVALRKAVCLSDSFT